MAKETAREWESQMFPGILGYIKKVVISSLDKENNSLFLGLLYLQEKQQ